MQIDWSTLPRWTNDAYKGLYASWKRFNVFYGGAGSGKSFFIVQRHVFRLCTIPGYNLLTIRKYGVTNRFSTFALFKQVISQWNLDDFFVVNKTDMTITFLPNKNQVLFLGMDDPEKVKSITFQSGILTSIWCEEANELAESDLMQLDLRLRGISNVPFQITVSFNPVSAYSWLKSYFFDNRPESCEILKTTYLDNQFIDEQYKQRLNSLTGTAFKVYALGEWGTVDGLVFKDFSIDDIPANAVLMGYGQDFGFSSDPAATCAIWERGDDIWIDEIIYQTNLTNQDLIKKYKDCGIHRHAQIIADSAEPKSIEEIYRAGFNIHPCRKGPDSIRHGIDTMLSKRIHITPRSTNAQKEFYSYTWKQDKEGKYLPVPIDCMNHLIDAARYRIAYGRGSPIVTNTASSLGL